MASDSKPFVSGRHVQLLKPLAGALLMTEITKVSVHNLQNALASCIWRGVRHAFQSTSNSVQAIRWVAHTRDSAP
jgi:hypothetical protein